MSALAELFVRRGVRVTGCDAHPGDTAEAADGAAAADSEGEVADE